MLKKVTISYRDPTVSTTLSLFTPEQIQKISHVSGLQKYLLFPPEQIFLELFSFTHGTLFWDTPVDIRYDDVQFFSLSFFSIFLSITSCSRYSSDILAGIFTRIKGDILCKILTIFSTTRNCVDVIFMLD